MLNFGNFELYYAECKASGDIFGILDIVPVLACFCRNTWFLLLVTFNDSTEALLPSLAIILSTTTKMYGFYFVAMTTKFVFQSFNHFFAANL